LPERAGLGTIAVAFVVAVRDREAGVAGFNRSEFKKQPENVKRVGRARVPGQCFYQFLNGEM
jgi:hypothetical protein